MHQIVISMRRSCMMVLLSFCFLQAGWLQFEDDAVGQKATVQLLSRDGLSCVLDVTVPGARVENVDTKLMTDTRHEVFALFSIGEFAYTGDIGKPKLPMVTSVLDVPHGATIQVEILNVRYAEIYLTDIGVDNRIMPVLASVPKTSGSVAQFVIDERMYATNVYYPDLIFEIEEYEGLARGHRLATLRLFPIQYNPLAGILRCYSHIQVRINFTNGNVVATQQAIAENYSPVWEDFIETMVINYPAYLEGVPPLPIYYDIFYNAAFSEAAESLAYWKNKKGYKVRLWDATGWNAGAIDDMIEAQTPLATYLAIIGDPNSSTPLPSWGNGSSTGDQTDLYYAESDGTGYLPDLYNARISVLDATQANTAVQKTLRYEHAYFGSAALDWLKRACFTAGFDAVYQGTGMATNWYCRNLLSSDGYTVDTLVMAEGEEETRVVDQINAGRAWCVYTGHGGKTLWALGHYTGDFTVTELTNQTNNLDMYAMPCGYCCLSGDYEHSENCFGETWDRLNDKGGSCYFGSVVNTLWEQDDILQRRNFDAIYTDSITARLYETGRFTQWGLFWLNNNTALSHKQYYFEAYHLFNDPSLDFWTDIPDTLTVTHSAVAFTGISDFTVSVSDAGIPVEDALVCCWIPSQSPDMHVSGYTNTSGTVTLTISPTADGDTMYVTVTKHNYIPYEANVRIIQTLPVREIGGTITSDETWYADTVYLVVSNLLVQEGVTITIQAGTIIKLGPGYIHFFCNLDLQGTEGNEVIFTSERDDEHGGDTNGDGTATLPAARDWRFVMVSYFSNNIHHCHFLYGGSSLPMVRIVSDDSAQVDLNACIVENYGVWGTCCYGPHASIVGNTISYPGQGGIRVPGTPDNIINNAITGLPEGIRFDAQTESSVCNIFANNISHCNSGIITYRSTLNINYNNFCNNGCAVANRTTDVVNAENNWWGHASGPYHPDLNPTGQGDTVSDNVNFDPWLTEPYAFDHPRTLFVISTSRFDKFWPGATENLKVRLAGFCYHPEVRGVVLDVDSSQGVLDAYADWDADDNWKRPSRANTVAEAIDGFLELKLMDMDSVENIILVGEDRIIPHYRMLDPLWPEFLRGCENKYQGVSGQVLPIAAAIDSNQILTDDVYGDMEDAPPYVPQEYIVSRLVENPAQIIVQIDRFLMNGSTVIPTRILVTSSDKENKDGEYEFYLQDAADAIVNVYQESFSNITVDDDLIQRSLTDPDYDRDDLIEHFLQFQNQITSFNNHAHHRYLHTPDESLVDCYYDVMQSSSQNLAGELIYSCGCHHGLNAGGNVYDYPEAFAYKDVAAFVGNTGYGICSRGGVLWSEELVLRLTESLVTGVNVGKALRDTKHSYWSNSLRPCGFTEKVTMVPVLYGLPYYNIASSRSLASTVQATHSRNDTRVGNDTLVVTIDGFIEQVAWDSSGVWYTFTGSEVEAEPDAPILSKLMFTYVNPDPIIEGLELISSTYHEEQPDLPAALAMWRTSDTVSPGVFVCDSLYPAPIWQLNTLEFADSLVQNLIIVPMQYYQPTNTWRLYDTLVFEILTGIKEGGMGEYLRYACAVEPNPFILSTLVKYSLPRQSDVSIEIFNVIGQRVRLLLDEKKDAGRYTLMWKGEDDRGKNLASGVYFLRFKADDFIQTKKMIICR